jgi:hypothetical protein
LGALLLVHLRYLGSHPRLAAPDLTAEAAAHMRRDVRLYALVPLVSMAASFYSPRFGMYLYLLLAIPAFGTSRIDRLTEAPAARRTDPPVEDS